MHELLFKAKHFLGKNSPIILTTISVVGTVATAIVASRDTLRANDAIIEAQMVSEDELTNKEVFQIGVKHYIPTALTVGATITAIIGAHTASTAKITAYSGAYAMAQEAARMYRDKTHELVSEKKAQQIDDAVADESLRHAKNDPKTVILSGGDDLCFDQFSGQYFHSTREKLREVQNDINATALANGWAGLNDFYYYPLNMEYPGAGEQLGWRDDMQCKLQFSSRTTEDGHPALVVSFEAAPQPDTNNRY